jgi:hypothetical protein
MTKYLISKKILSKGKIFTKYKRSKNLNHKVFVFARNQFISVLSEILLYDDEIKTHQ